MVVLAVLGGIALLLFGFLMIRIRFVIAYSDELTLRLRVLFFGFTLLPSRDKRKKKRSMSERKAEKIRGKLQKKQQKKIEKKKQKKSEKAEKPKKSFGEILDLLQLATSLVSVLFRHFFRHLRIRVARIRIIVASEDAATTAIAYGAITQSFNVLLPLLESVRNFPKLKKADLFVGVDFTKDAPQTDLKLVFSIRLWQIFDIAFRALGAFLRHKLKHTENKNQQHKF